MATSEDRGSTRHSQLLLQRIRVPARQRGSKGSDTDAEAKRPHTKVMWTEGQRQAIGVFRGA